MRHLLSNDILKTIEDIIKENNKTNEVVDMMGSFLKDYMDVDPNHGPHYKFKAFLWGLLSRGMYDTYRAIAAFAPENNILMETRFIMDHLVEGDYDDIHYNCPLIDQHAFAAFIYTHTDEPWIMWYGLQTLSLESYGLPTD